MNNILFETPTSIYEKAKEGRTENCTSNLEIAEKNVAIAKEAINLHYKVFYFNSRVAYSDRITE
jgi:hypothetical protein